MFNIGDIVFHNDFGKGEVVGIRNQGLYIEVRFGSSYRTILSTYLKKTNTTPTNKIGQPRTVNIPSSSNVSSPVLSYNGPSPRDMIEAFRLGVVPYGGVKNFIFGREKEIKTIKEWLYPDSAGALIIRSGYGSGKSHLLDYINTFASENQYAVCSAEFDQETPPYRPKLIYRQFVKSFKLTVNNKVFTFRDFIREIASRQVVTYSANGYVNQMIQLVKYYQGDQDFWDWIEGKRNGRYCGLAFYDNGTASNIYCHLIAEVAARVRNIQSTRGLVVILDEAESVNNATQIQQAKGWHFIRGLTMLSANDQRIKDEKVIYSPGPDGSYFGDETGLVYSGHESNLRYCTDIPSYIKVVFAFTDGRYGMEEWLSRWEISHIPVRLETLSESALKEIFFSIYKIYASTYNFRLSVPMLNSTYVAVREKTQFKSSVIRYFIKGTVEILDILRYDPSLSPEEIE